MEDNELKFHPNEINNNAIKHNIECFMKKTDDATLANVEMHGLHVKEL